MKEIKILMRELRQYPENFFVYPVKEDEEHSIDGLVVCDKEKEQQDFIEVGEAGWVVL